MQQTIDRVHFYRGLFGSEAKCRLRVYEETEKPPVAIATELPDHPGTSVTNGAGPLATEVGALLERPEAGMVWIEHYPKHGEGRGSDEQESFDLVTFSATASGFVDPKWRRLTTEEVERLIEGTLESEGER